MICPYCGKDNPDDSKLCGYCGGSLELPVEQHTIEDKLSEPAVDAIPASTQPLVPHTAPSQAPARKTGGIYGNRIWWFIGCFVLVFLIVGCGVLAWGLYKFIDLEAILRPVTMTPTILPAVTAIREAQNTPTLIPNQTLQPTLTLTSTPLSQIAGIVYSDDFSDPNSGWDRADEADYYTDYFENAYRIIINTDMSDSWANPKDQQFGDVLIEVDATKNGGPDDNDFGVICRYQGLDRFYYAVISSDGYYGITKVTSESSELLGFDDLQYSDLINQGFVTNHMRFDCLGDTLTLYVNGQQIDQQTDSDYSSGNVGLIAGTYDTPGTDILFDNFLVSQP